jgi:hypothetical protein
VENILEKEGMFLLQISPHFDMLLGKSMSKYSVTNSTHFDMLF